MPRTRRSADRRSVESGIRGSGGNGIGRLDERDVRRDRRQHAQQIIAAPAIQRRASPEKERHIGAQAGSDPREPVVIGSDS